MAIGRVSFLCDISTTAEVFFLCALLRHEPGSLAPSLPACQAGPGPSRACCRCFLWGFGNLGTDFRGQLRWRGRLPPLPSSRARGAMFQRALPSRFPQPRLRHRPLQGWKRAVAFMGGRGFMQVGWALSSLTLPQILNTSLWNLSCCSQQDSSQTWGHGGARACLSVKCLKRLKLLGTKEFQRGRC